ncbi:MAG: hypothetical protein ACLQHS_00760, partial [Candidatus Limnocylindrales bacterium]
MTPPTLAPRPLSEPGVPLVCLGVRSASLDTAEQLHPPRDYRNNYPFNRADAAREEEAERAAAHDRAK